MTRFNAPPGWPVEPEWFPSPQWQPDPSWPPAPKGWQFFLETPTAATDFVSQAETRQNPKAPMTASLEDGNPRDGDLKSASEATDPIARRTDSSRPFQLGKRAKGVTIGVAVTIAAAALGFKLGGANHHPAPTEMLEADNPQVQEAPSASAAESSTAVERQTPSRTQPAAIPSIDDPDLGLTVPMSRPACDGTGIVVLGSVYTPGRYRQQVEQILAMNPGAAYLRTDLACPSLRQNLDGNPIYAVFRVAGKTKEAICDAVAEASADAYGKWLDNITDPTTPIRCDN